ncbi:hypothetical protein CAEBREN_12690 [Caenorhabditis brenneri]|uniref:Serpin domain-containing protein n=1 Tax=Caenorhabditis brenneri TaxID=135651 RepID=G0NJ11_CAEBE|nr:hypothetical protein CAEBREN_12690 [Caenorhabditis brenneri]
MSIFQSDQFKSAMTEVVQKCLQPLEEKMEKRLRRLEKIYNDKADRKEEEVNLFWPAERAKLRNVKITLPVFSCNTTTDLKKVLKEVGIKEQAFVHQAHFQLNQSGVNVPHVPSEDASFEIIEHQDDNEKPIEFVANRPFMFMLTKSNHVMYLGWYQ